MKYVPLVRALHVSIFRTTGEVLQKTQRWPNLIPTTETV